ncbi:hypothetical protein FCH28_29565 [Streptomyces piniterrae]|uniref:Uncharacterized protein n=1 Tax=Streptomyces piniterrae TaxID=2571125 RepID=A0A4U0MUU8_9ACTN|nr:MrpF/PhaF family protein [Streptomyces piniterrae]TJZ44496.1 hypothetical protein FCH28_29565 [Streptomyces piniterrae]
MNGWLLAAAVLLVAGLAPVLWTMAVGEPRTRLVAQNLSTVLACPVFLLAAQGFGRPSYTDLALVLAMLGPAGTLVYARFLGVLPRSRVVLGTAWTVVPATVLPLCVVAGPGRAMAKLLVIGVLVVAGNTVTSAGTDRHG